MLNKLINKNTLVVNWDEVYKIPEFLKLIDIGYHELYHQEKDAYTHTKNTVDSLYSLPEWDTLTPDEKYILVAAALFHDIGKGIKGEIDVYGNWSFPYHASNGERITRNLLWDEEFKTRELICSLVKYHMKPNFLHEKDDETIDRTIKEISINSNVKLLYLLNISDSMGSISIESIQEKLSKKEILKNRAIELDCYGKPFDVTWPNPNPSAEFSVYMMCGVSGSGKSTYRETHLPHLPVVSRDIIRKEIGLEGEKPHGNKEQEDLVTELFNNKVNEYCGNRQSFVVDNMYIKRKYRDELRKQISRFGPWLEIIYVETSIDNMIDRRAGQISNKILKKMRWDLEIPQLTECHSLKIEKN